MSGGVETTKRDIGAHHILRKDRPLPGSKHLDEGKRGERRHESKFVECLAAEDVLSGDYASKCANYNTVSRLRLHNRVFKVLQRRPDIAAIVRQAMLGPPPSSQPSSTRTSPRGRLSFTAFASRHKAELKTLERDEIRSLKKLFGVLKSSPDQLQFTRQLRVLSHIATAQEKKVDRVEGKERVMGEMSTQRRTGAAGRVPPILVEKSPSRSLEHALSSSSSSTSSSSSSSRPSTSQMVGSPRYAPPQPHPSLLHNHPVHRRLFYESKLTRKELCSPRSPIVPSLGTAASSAIPLLERADIMTHIFDYLTDTELAVTRSVCSWWKTFSHSSLSRRRIVSIDSYLSPRFTLSGILKNTSCSLSTAHLIRDSFCEGGVSGFSDSFLKRELSFRSNVIHLDLSAPNRISEATLGHILSESPGLTSLNLSHSRTLTGNFLKRVSRWVGHSLTELRLEGLKFNQIDSHSLVYLSKRCPHLREISFRNSDVCRVDDTVLLSLAQHCTQLQVFRAGGKYMGDECGITPSGLFHFCTAMNQLRIIELPPVDTGNFDLAITTLAEHGVLEEFVWNFSSSQSSTYVSITNESLHGLANHCPRLRVLELFNVCVSNEGITEAAMANICVSCPRLSRFSLHLSSRSGGKHDPFTTNLVYKHLTRCLELEHVDLRNIAVSNKGITKLFQRVPNLSSFGFDVGRKFSFSAWLSANCDGKRERDSSGDIEEENYEEAKEREKEERDTTGSFSLEDQTHTSLSPLSSLSDLTIRFPASVDITVDFEELGKALHARVPHLNTLCFEVPEWLDTVHIGECVREIPSVRVCHIVPGTQKAVKPISRSVLESAPHVQACIIRGVKYAPFPSVEWRE